ncbi:MAG: SAM hydrolase/SAM-dependent halogenase family protein, partial [Planctomycetota bacterium]
MCIVTLITDYGTRDHYAGVLKGVMLGIAPQISITDITHDIEPHNVLHGAFVLRQVWAWYPPGTIHLAIVDPGVGSERRIIVGKLEGRYVVAPNNGLVTLVHRELSVEAVHFAEDPRFFLSRPSATFHGRDMMAPVAAHLASGVDMGEFGPVADSVELLPVEYMAQSAGDSIRGRVLHVDRFGTLITNIRAEQLRAFSESVERIGVLVNGTSIGPIRSTFCDVPPGTPLALIGGGGLLEIAIN